MGESRTKSKHGHEVMVNGSFKIPTQGASGGFPSYIVPMEPMKLISEGAMLLTEAARDRYRLALVHLLLSGDVNQSAIDYINSVINPSRTTHDRMV